MNRLDCSLGENKQKMMFFRESHLDSSVAAQKWDRVKVVCRQPFKINHDVFGLAMFVLHGLGDFGDKATATVGQGPARKSDVSTPKGLDLFKKKAASMAGSPKTPYVSSLLKNLENRRNTSEKEGEESRGPAPSSSFNSSAMSRTGKLLVQANSITGKKNSFESEAAEFLESCGFEKKSFAEIESITFRQVKELWLEKKKSELKKEEKNLLKSLSTEYLTDLLSNPRKRQREELEENVSKKKRKISEQVKTMRETTDIDELYDEVGSMRNKVATTDVVKVDDKSDDEEITEMKKKFNLTSSTPIQPAKIKSAVLTTPDLKDSRPVFDLNSSPEMSPDQETVRKPVKATAPNYNRRHLLSVPHEVLIQHGVLVQVYNYKKDKKLPLKGNLELSAKKGVSVTFFKVGADVHLEYQGRFFNPDILPEHIERVFKKFSSEEVLSDKYPDDIASLLKMSSCNQTEDTKPQLGESGGKKKEKEEKREERKETEKTESGSCPLCQQSFPLSSLPDHAADCQGAPSSQPSRSVLVHSRLPSNRSVSV